jgi:hypothetical protein
MGTRCRGLGEILARLTGPVAVRELGQIVTRFQITERRSSIPQMEEIDAASRWQIRCALHACESERVPPRVSDIFNSIIGCKGARVRSLWES